MAKYRFLLTYYHWSIYTLISLATGCVYIFFHLILGLGSTLTLHPAPIFIALAVLVMGYYYLQNEAHTAYIADQNRLNLRAERLPHWELDPLQCRLQYPDGSFVPLDVTRRSPHAGLEAAVPNQQGQLVLVTGYRHEVGGLTHHIIVWRRKAQ